jgi:signal transduction histidine kinase
MTADLLPPRTGGLYGVEPKAAVDLGLMPELMVHLGARGRPRVQSSYRSVDSQLQAVERAFGRHRTDPRIQDSLETARGRFSRLADAAGEASESIALAFAADLFTSLAIERPWLPEDVDPLASKLAALLGISPEQVVLHLYVNAARAPQLLELPPGVALEAQLSMLVVLSPMIVEAGVWTKGPGGRPQCLISVGKTTTTRRFQIAAARVLDGQPANGGEGTIRGVPVRRWQSAWGALVVRVRTRELPGVFLDEAGAAMSPVLERELLLRRSATREHSLVHASEKRLSRLGFDLHDGALQHLAALKLDLHLLRTQLVAGTDRAIVASRTDDLDARIGELDRVLRELAHSLEPQSLVRRPLLQVLESEVAAFGERTGIETSLTASGEFGLMTPSQKIALIRVVQEALTNIREHTSAKKVEVRVTESRGHVQARIRDDGEGFSVAPTLLHAAKRGRLGLVGSSERVRLLGGTFDVRSNVGGPTTISLSLPRWQPLATETAAPIPALAAD